MWGIVILNMIIAGILLYIGYILSDIKNEIRVFQQLFIQFNHEYREVNNKPKRGRKPKEDSEF